MKASKQGCKLVRQVYKIPTYQFSISHSRVRLPFIPSDTRRHTASSEVNPQGPSIMLGEQQSETNGGHLKLREKICEPLEVASGGVAELYIRSQAAVIN